MHAIKIKATPAINFSPEVLPFVLLLLPDTFVVAVTT